MEIRRAILKDIDNILNIYSYAREKMRKNGNPNQWGTSKPSAETLLDDINNGNLYLQYENDNIFGVFMFKIGEDPTYSFIEGKWLNSEPYGVIHRIAHSKDGKNVLQNAVLFAESKTDNIRIDTHKDNLKMQILLERYGFSRCGIIYLEDGSPRIAYQRTIIRRNKQ